MTPAKRRGLIDEHINIRCVERISKDKRQKSYICHIVVFNESSGRVAFDVSAHPELKCGIKVMSTKYTCIGKRRFSPKNKQNIVEI